MTEEVQVDAAAALTAAQTAATAATEAAKAAKASVKEAKTNVTAAEKYKKSLAAEAPEHADADTALAGWKAELATREATLATATAEVTSTAEALKTAKAAAKGAGKPAKEAKVKVERETQNGVAIPGEGTKTRQVWTTASELTTSLGRPALASEVLGALAGTVEKGTVMTQYNRWCKFHAVSREARQTARAATKPVAPVAEPAAA